MVQDKNINFLFSPSDINHGRMFEQKVYHLLSDYRMDDEPINYETPIGGLSRKMLVDFEMPNGFKILGIKDPVYVETKDSSNYNTLRSTIRRFDLAKHLKNDDAVYILIYDDSYGITYSYIPDNRRFLIYGYHQFSALLEMQGAKYRATHSRAKDFGKPKKDEANKEGKEEGKEPKAEQAEVKQETWQEKSERLFEELNKNLAKEVTTLILGAGVSVDSKVPSWENLLIGLIMKSRNVDNIKAREIYKNLYKKSGNSYLITARMLFAGITDNDTRARWMKEIIYQPVDEFLNNPHEKTTLNLLAAFINARNINQVITYNYDTLLEESLDEIGEHNQPIYNKDDRRKGKLPVYHVHGIIPHEPNSLIAIEPVLSEKDYHVLYSDPNNWSNIVTLYAMNQTTCILFGLSMVDPNLRRLLDCSTGGGKNQRHYIFMPREYDDKEWIEAQEDFFNKQEETLENLGLNVIWFEVTPEKGFRELKDKIRIMAKDKDKERVPDPTYQ